MKKLKKEQGTFKIQSNDGRVVELPNKYRSKIEEYINGNSDELDNYLNTLPEFQEGGGTDDPNVRIMQQIAKALQEGTDPQEVYKYLVQQGIPDAQAQEMIQNVVKALQEQQQTNMQQQEVEEEQEAMQDGGGIMFGDQLKLPKENRFMAYVKEGGNIHIDPSKKGTFKAQATRMGMGVQEAAKHILANKEEYSPAMVKKANFARNFAKEKGGEQQYMADAGNVFAKPEDNIITTTYKNQLENLVDNPMAKFFMQMNSLSNPTSPIHLLPNKGLIGKVKGAIGAGSMLSGAALGYMKPFAKDKSTDELINTSTGEIGNPNDIYEKRKKEWDKERGGYYKINEHGMPIWNELPFDESVYQQGGNIPIAQQGKQINPFPNIIPPNTYYNYGNIASTDYYNYGNPFAVGSMQGLNRTIDDTGINNINIARWLIEQNRKGIDPFNLASYFNREKPETDVFKTEQGDPAGTLAAINAITGANMLANSLNQISLKSYEEKLQELGNTQSRNRNDVSNPFGVYTTNSGFLNMQPDKYASRVYEEGGEYDLTDEEIEEIKRNGGEVEILD